MIQLFSFCDMPWWLTWLLPFLLGLALGWAIWGKFKSMIADLESRINSLNIKIKGLEDNLADCRSHSATLEGDMSLAKGKMREAEEALRLAQSKGTNTMSAASVAATAVSSFAASTATQDGGVIVAGTADKYAKISSDNLQIIEGIGPKMEEVLKANGITNHQELANSNPDALRAILDKYGDSYKIIDPSTWASQAKLGASRDFTALVDLQKQLDGGVATGTTSDSKLEKLMVKMGIIKAYKLDDLKVIEGVGPKIEELLQNGGIKTWAQLAATTAGDIKSILDAGGSNFQLADPTTWPKQAELLAAGKYDEFQEYTDFLNGGKES